MTVAGKTARRILIRSTNWIGDAVMSVAAIRELRRIHPEGHLTLFAKEWVAGLFSGQGLVDEIISFTGSGSSLSYQPVLRGFDTAILLQNAFRSALTVFLARIPERIGYDTYGRGFLLTRKASPRIKEVDLHQLFYYLDLLYLTGLSPVNYIEDANYRPDISLKPSAPGFQNADYILTEAGVSADSLLVGINPGAFYGPAKRWLSDRYAQLADRLIDEKSATVIIFGSASEKPLAEEIRRSMKGKALLLSGRTDLPTLMALISRCRLFVTNDSGPMHLAAALGTPLVALFGSTDDQATGPYSPAAKVIHKHVECSPCLRRECPIDLRCFTGISVEEVLEACRDQLANGPARIL